MNPSCILAISLIFLWLRIALIDSFISENLLSLLLRTTRFSSSDSSSIDEYCLCGAVFELEQF